MPPLPSLKYSCATVCPMLQLVEADTLTEIFRDNAHLCSKVSESEIQHFIHCIEKNRNVKYLKFLQTIVQGGKGSRRAQEMVMNEVGYICATTMLVTCSYTASCQICKTWVTFQLPEPYTSTVTLCTIRALTPK